MTPRGIAHGQFASERGGIFTATLHQTCTARQYHHRVWNRRGSMRSFNLSPSICNWTWISAFLNIVLGQISTIIHSAKNTSSIRLEHTSEMELTRPFHFILLAWPNIAQVIHASLHRGVRQRTFRLHSHLPSFTSTSTPIAIMGLLSTRKWYTSEYLFSSSSFASKNHSACNAFVRCFTHWLRSNYSV